MEQVTDEQLFGLFQSGDRQAFARLVRRYEKELYNFLVKFLGRASLAEDAFQEAFLQVHVSAASFDTTRRFRPWLYTIAANKARDLLRSQARRPAINITAVEGKQGEYDLWGHLLREETTAEDIFAGKQQQQQVRAVVGQLPDNLREILVLAYFSQLSYKEVAESLGIPLGTVKSRLHTAVAAFAGKYREVTEKENG